MSVYCESEECEREWVYRGGGRHERKHTNGGAPRVRPELTMRNSFGRAARRLSSAPAYPSAAIHRSTFPVVDSGRREARADPANSGGSDAYRSPRTLRGTHRRGSPRRGVVDWCSCSSSSSDVNDSLAAE